MSHFDSISNQYSSARSLIYIFFRHPRKSKVQNYSVTDRNTIKTNFRTFQVTNNINQSREIHNLWNDKASKTTSVCTKGKSTTWAHAKPNSSGIQCLKTKLKKREAWNIKTFIKCFIYHQVHGSEKKENDQSIATNLTQHPEFQCVFCLKISSPYLQC